MSFFPSLPLYKIELNHVLSGHYDLIYKDDQPIQVLLQTHNPQYVSYAPDQFRGDEDSLTLSSRMFPGSNDIPFHAIPSTQYPSSGPNYGSNHNRSAQTAFQSPSMAQPPYFSSAVQPGARRQLPIRSQSLPYSYYSSQPITQLSQHFPPSPQSPQPPSPVTPSTNFPISTSTPNAKEPQIRLNKSCLDYHLGRHETIPLDPGSFGTSALSQAHFTNAEFQPQMWKADEEYGKHS